MKIGGSWNYHDSTFIKSEALRSGIYLELTLQTVKSGKYAKQKKYCLKFVILFCV